MRKIILWKRVLFFWMVFFGNNVFADLAQDYETDVESCMQSFYKEMDDFYNTVKSVRNVKGFAADDDIANMCLQKIVETDLYFNFFIAADRTIFFLCRDLIVHFINLYDHCVTYQSGFPERTGNLLREQLDEIESTFGGCANEASERLVMHFFLDLDAVKTLVIGLFNEEDSPD